MRIFGKRFEEEEDWRLECTVSYEDFNFYSNLVRKKKGELRIKIRSSWEFLEKSLMEKRSSKD